MIHELSPTIRSRISRATPSAVPVGVYIPTPEYYRTLSKASYYSSILRMSNYHMDGSY